MAIYYKGKEFNVDNKGFLIDYTEYCSEWKEYAARAAKISSISEFQSKVIDLIREYYIERGEAPMIRYIVKSLGVLPSEVIKAFPFGLTTAVKIAGLPKPKSCK